MNFTDLTDNSLSFAKGISDFSFTNVALGVFMVVIIAQFFFHLSDIRGTRKLNASLASDFSSLADFAKTTLGYLKEMNVNVEVIANGRVSL